MSIRRLLTAFGRFIERNAGALSASTPFGAMIYAEQLAAKRRADAAR